MAKKTLIRNIYTEQISQSQVKSMLFYNSENWHMKSISRTFFGGGFIFFRGGFQNLKLIFNPSWFRGIFLVHAVIMKLKSNVTPQNEQNLFRILGGLPLPNPHLHLLILEILEGVNCVRNWELVLFFYKSNVIGYHFPQGEGFRGHIFLGVFSVCGNFMER